MTRENFDNVLSFFHRYRLLPQRPSVVDVGCCRGWFTQDFLRYWPEAICTGIDLDDRAQLDYPGRFIHVACSDQAGHQMVWIIPNQAGISELGTLVNRNAEFPGLQWVPGWTVRVARLDELVAQADFIKVDAELMDLRVVRGATGLMAGQAPPVAVMFELVSQTLDYTSDDDLLKWFAERGYRLMGPNQANTTLEALTSLNGILNVVALREDAYWLVQLQEGRSSLWPGISAF